MSAAGKLTHQSVALAQLLSLANFIGYEEEESAI